MGDMKKNLHDIFLGKKNKFIKWHAWYGVIYI